MFNGFVAHGSSGIVPVPEVCNEAEQACQLFGTLQVVVLFFVCQHVYKWRDKLLTLKGIDNELAVHHVQQVEQAFLLSALVFYIDSQSVGVNAAYGCNSIFLLIIYEFGLYKIYITCAKLLFIKI